MLFTRYNAMAGDVCFDSVWPLHNSQLCLNLNLKPVATISINNAFKKISFSNHTLVLCFHIKHPTQEPIVDCDINKKLRKESCK